MLKLTGSLEQEVLDTLWDSKDPLIPSEVQSKMKKDLAYTTVMTMLQRMYKKRVLGRKKQGNAYAYYPLYSKEKAASLSLKGMYQGLINSYGNLAISEFLDTLKENPEHQNLLKEFLENNSAKK